MSVGLTQFADSALIFKRGNGVAKAKGRFIMEKVNMLLEMLLMEPVLKLIGRPKAVIADINEDLKKKQSAKVRKDGSMKEERHDTTRIERRTLRRLLSTPSAVLRNFLSEHELQEPTFKRWSFCTAWPSPSLTCRRDGGSGPLILKSFHDIPMADLE